MRPNFLQPLIHHLERKLGAVALAAEMPEKQLLQFARHDLFGCLRGGFVGKVSVTTENSLFQTPRSMRTILQHLHVVIRFQDQNVRAPHPFQHQLSRMTEVGQDSDIAIRCSEQEPDRILRVVRYAEGFDDNVLQFEARAGRKKTAFQARLQLILQSILCLPVTEDWDAQLLPQLEQSLHMVRMLVSDQNGGKIFRCASDRSEALADLAQAEARINENASLRSLDISTISCGTTS